MKRPEESIAPAGGREEAHRLIVMALALIRRDDGKVLVIKEGDMPYHGCWVLPGGYVRRDETAENAVVREIREEVGIEVAPRKVTGVYDDFSNDVDGQRVHYVLIVFEAKIIAGEAKVSREAAEYAWMNFDSRTMPKMAMPDVIKTILADSSRTGKLFRLRRFLLTDLFGKIMFCVKKFRVNRKRAAAATRGIVEKSKPEIMRLLKQEGCAICRISDEYLKKALFWFFNESYGEGAVVGEYVDYWGFCKDHTMLVSEVGPTYQKSVIYAWTINNKLPKLKTFLKTLKTSLAAGRPLKPIYVRKLRKLAEEVNRRGECVFCETLNWTGRHFTQMLVDVLSDSDVKEQFRKSSGLCMQHFFEALDYLGANNLHQLAEVVERQIIDLSILKEEFEEFFRKTDYRFKDEPKGSEQTAWIRATERFFGELRLKEINKAASSQSK